VRQRGFRKCVLHCGNVRGLSATLTEEAPDPPLRAQMVAD
jgi:hypothetical protein